MASLSTELLRFLINTRERQQGHPSIHANEFLRGVGVPPERISHLLRDLSNEGLIAQTPINYDWIKSFDEMAIHLAITDKGERFLESLDAQNKTLRLADVDRKLIWLGVALALLSFALSCWQTFGSHSEPENPLECQGQR